MSEYWKSTPKYWCKFCSTFVRDTGLERKAHEATPRHQSSIQRSLRNLHKTTEREERDKQRAKDEVARLNGLVAAKSSSSTSNIASAKSNSTAPPPKATADERKRQAAQLAAMGISVPQEHTKETTGGSEWSTVSETPIYHVKQEDGESKSAAAFGVRKRKLDEDDEEAEAVVRKGWGSKFKTYAGSKGDDEHLDALLTSTVIKKKDTKKEEPDMKEEDHEIRKEEHDLAEGENSEPKASSLPLKKEDSISNPDLAAIPPVEQASASVKHEDTAAAPADPPIVFKKRKGKR